jgi:hypothetical protein
MAPVIMVLTRERPEKYNEVKKNIGAQEELYNSDFE